MNLKVSIGESEVPYGKSDVIAGAVAIALAACGAVIALVILAPSSSLLTAAIIVGCAIGLLGMGYHYRHELVALSGRRGATSAPDRGFIVPIEPPLPPRNFEGRGKELRKIHDYMASAPTRPAIITITGPAGIGKSSLARMYASRYRSHFPDGQLFARIEHSMGGSSPSYEILGRFLSALQLPDDPVAENAGGRLAQYKELTHDRSLLVIIDDACHADCVLDLLPSGQTCAAIVTSREPLPGLPPAMPIELRPLTVEESIRLLESAVGRDRVASDPEAAGQLAGTGYPLAIELAATALTRRPHWSLGVATALVPASERSETATPETAINSNLDLIYGLLSRDERRALRCIALLDGPVFMAWELAALLDTGESEAIRLADNLARLGLVRRTSGGRAGLVEFSIDEPIQPYLRERMHAETTESKRAERLQSLARARAERAVLDADIVDQLHQVIWDLKDSGQLPAAFDRTERALAAARESRQSQAEALALGTLADLRLELGNIEGAEELAAAAERLAPGLAPAVALRCLGRIMCQQGDPQAGEELLSRALAAARRTNDAAEEVRALLEQANALALAQQRDRAVVTADLAIASLRQHADHIEMQAESVYGAARVRLACDDPQAALRYLDETAPTVPESQVLWGAWIELLRGRACIGLGDYRNALDAAAEAIERFGAMSHRYGVACSRLLFGRACAAQDRLYDAISAVADALETLQNCGDRYTADDAKRLLGTLLLAAARTSRDWEDLDEASQLLEDAGDDEGVRALQAEFAVGQPQPRRWQPGAGRARQASAMQRGSR